jgi:hypothetical protein
MKTIMKNFFTLAVVLITVQAANAQMMNDNNYYNNQTAAGSLVIRSASIVKDYVVTVNNRQNYLVTDNSNNVYVSGIGVGQHYIEVYRLIRNIWGQEKRQNVYSGNVQVRRGVETTINIDAFERVNISERQLYYDNGNNYGNGNYGNDNGCGNNRDRGRGNKFGHRKHNRNDRNDRDYRRFENNGNNNYYGWNQ